MASIAVIVVCRNALSDLRDTIESVVRLLDQRVKLIVIDGASTDGTVEYLNGIRASLYYSSSEPDAGIYQAMNKGWSVVPAESIVLYLGAGDCLLQLPDQSELNQALDGGGNVLLGRCSIGALPFESRWGWEMKIRNTAHHQALLVPKALHESPPFDEGLRIYADWDFNLRLQAQGYSAKHTDNLRTYAKPGGASWRHDLREISLVAWRWGGALTAAASVAVNAFSRASRELREWGVLK